MKKFGMLLFLIPLVVGLVVAVALACPGKDKAACDDPNCSNVDAKAKGAPCPMAQAKADDGAKDTQKLAGAPCAKKACPLGKKLGKSAVAEPLKAGDTALCPCGEKISLNADTPHLEAGGKHYYFCSQGCEGKFQGAIKARAAKKQEAKGI